MSRFARTSPGINSRTPRARRNGRGAYSNPAGFDFNTLAQAVGSLITANTGPPRSKASRAVAPEKCMYIMTTSAFREWRRSMDDWIKLSRMSCEDAVLNIRLNCVEKLRCAIDAQFSKAKWESLALEDAFDVIKKISTKSVNVAVLWDKFFSRKQGANESAKEYLHYCQQAALDCDFRCPGCNIDFSDYILLKKLVSGLGNANLKQDMLQNFDKYNSIEKFMIKCESFEEAERECSGVLQRGGTNVLMGAIATGVEDGPTTLEEDKDVAGVKTAYKKQKLNWQSLNKQKQKCCFCNRLHDKGRQNCPASNASCFKCGRSGHFANCCSGNSSDNSDGEKCGRKSGIRPGTVVSSVNVRGKNVACNRSARSERQNITMHIGAASCTQPVLSVKIVCNNGNKSCDMDVVADTGAEVCIAGIMQAKRLGIDVYNLNRSRVNLQHAAGGPMNVLGRCAVAIHHGERVANEYIYFVKGTCKLFLSLNACKSLGLVDSNFPNHTINHVHSNMPVVPSDVREKPDKLPCPPIEENVPRLERWLLERFSGTTFNVDRRPFPVMVGKPHRIHLLPNASPYACHTPIPVPKHWEHEVKCQIDEDVKAGILCPVPAGEVTEWCSRMVVVGKKDGAPRRTVDFQKLNAQCKRETHHTLAPFDMVSSVPIHTYKTTVDAYWGFHQVELDKESRKLTTFITPWGRYQYCRTPMGHCSASDAYTKRFDDIIVGITRKAKCVDDILLYDVNIEGAFWHAYELLEICEKNGITLHPSKFNFCKREVDFVGYTLSWERYLPSEDRLAAIKRFPMPEHPSISDIRSWFGLVNQLAPFVATAPIMAPFKELLKKGSSKKVYWDTNLRMKFEEAKDALCKLISDGLAYYDKTRPTLFMTDWCKDGMGFVVLQQYCSCVSSDFPFCCPSGWKLALCGSRHLSRAEVNYAPVEGEAAAVVWCLKKARLFLLGCPNLILATDHRPLVKLFGDRELRHIENPRLFRLKEKTLHFKFEVKYVSGKKNVAADTLSRYPCLRAAADDTEVLEAEELEVQTRGRVIASSYVIEDDVIVLDSNDVEMAGTDDVDYQLLLKRVRDNSWPKSRNLVEPELKQYFQIRDRLSYIGGVVTYAFDEGHIRLVIPVNLRKRVARCLHSGHQGVDSMLRRARQAVYWPGMEADLNHERAKCETCNIHAPSQQQEPLINTDPPVYPFQKTVADFFQVDGRFYLAYADRLTGWLELSYFTGGVTSSKIIPVLRRMFCRWGTPEEISTDGGTNLSSAEMLDFYRRWGVKLRLASAHYPQSNGRAEAAVRSAKRIIRDNIRGDGSLDTDELARALMQYRNTPLRDVDKSPAQLTLGRQLRDSVPMFKAYHLPDSHWSATLQEREKALLRSMDRSKKLYDLHAKQLPYLRVGNRVVVQDPVTKKWDKTGLVMERYPYRQYLIKLDGSGRMSKRNRRHLKYVQVIQPPLLSARDPTPAQTESPMLTRPVPVRGRASERISKRPAWLRDYTT